jgi:methionine-rich copper-binding protein CopC
LERLFLAVRSSAVGRLLLLLAVAVVAGCFAAPAFAHAEVVSTSPQDGAVVPSVPTEGV